MFNKLILSVSSDQAGDLYEKIRNNQRALECYCKGGAFRKGKSMKSLFHRAVWFSSVQFVTPWNNYFPMRKVVGWYQKNCCTVLFVFCFLSPLCWDPQHADLIPKGTLFMVVACRSSVGQSTVLIQIHLLDGFAHKLVDMSFWAHRGWILMTLVILWLFFSPHHKVVLN